MSKLISLEEVRKHNTENDLWFVYDKKVYDVTDFVDSHPGGVDTLLAVAGDDGTNDFNSVGHSDSAKLQLEQFLIGTLDPRDAEQMKPVVQGSQSSSVGIAIAVGLLGIIIYFVLFR